MSQFAAHIITADAVALGDPEILIFEHDAEDSTDVRIVERLTLHLDTVLDALMHIEGQGKWRPTGDETLVQPGYWIVDVERVHTPGMNIVTLSTDEQAQYLADTVAGSGYRLEVHGSTARISDGALSVLADLDEHADGHCDRDGHIWIGGTGFTVERV